MWNCFTFWNIIPVRITVFSRMIYPIKRYLREVHFCQVHFYNLSILEWCFYIAKCAQYLRSIFRQRNSYNSTKMLILFAHTERSKWQCGGSRTFWCGSGSHLIQIQIILLGWKKISSNLQLLFPKSPKTCHCNFLSKNAGGRVRGEG